MRGQRLRYSLALICLTLATVITFGVPLVGTAAIDHAIGTPAAAPSSPRLIAWLLQALGGADHLRTHLWLAPVAMVALALVAGVFSYVKGWLAALASEQIARQLKDDLYDHLNHLPATYHDQAGTGDLVQRCTSDVETTRQFLATQVMQIGNAAVLAAAALPLMLALDVPMTLVSFALVGPLIVYGYVFFRKIQHVFREVDEAEGALTAVIQENLTGIRVVRAFARQEFERNRLATPNALFRDRNIRMLRLMSWYWSISDFAALSQLGLALLVGAHWVAQGRLSIGLLYGFLAYLSLMLWPVREIGRILTDLGKTSVALSRIREILAVARERDPAPSFRLALLPERLRGTIAVRDLHFAHAGGAPTAEGAGALNGLSFDVAAGETLAILGPSGAGKSTLMHLLLRLYDYTEGSIRLDGHELSALPRSWVRGQIGVVMQEPFLFSKTLRENLRLGHNDAADPDIHDAARMAGIHETILTFEEGYATLVGERGLTLSGGQRQRLAIARAVLKRPPLLILDDALSAVDAANEAAILHALQQRRGSATTLVIAHRLATLAHADRILVLDHGRIIQSGTHAELAGQPGLYQRLWEIQTSIAAELNHDLKSA
ncbi:ABC transporter related [Opitutus terrae PB90-1]|uniref:ABC transporter related n=2 Tax=Opitutus terrae TaxID=107709 RepID=B1ZYN1_OPITP|nr:ABC transporter related [Opitutus terrae PB90-1]